MKLKLSLFLLISVAALQVSAQTKKATTANNSSLIWEVSGKGLKTPSYLFGTYHLAGKNIVDSISVIRQKFDQTKAVVTEVIMDETAMAKMMPAMMLPGKPLDSIFTPAEYKLITENVKAATGMPNIIGFNKFKPSAVQIVLMTIMAPKTTSESNPQLDTWFQTEGKKRNNKVIGLETVEFQSDLLLNADMEVQKKHLLSFVKDLDKGKATTLKMYRLYLAQDMDGLAKLMDEETDDYTPQEMDALLKNRNLKWMNDLPGIMATQPTFVAVGAAHLVGQYGLINQLRLKGYTVKAVKM